MSMWPQYELDNHATVAEAVADLRQERFRVQTVVLPTGRPANMHLAIADASSDSAVFEYVDDQPWASSPIWRPVSDSRHPVCLFDWR